MKREGEEMEGGGGGGGGRERKGERCGTQKEAA